MRTTPPRFELGILKIAVLGVKPRRKDSKSLMLSLHHTAVTLWGQLKQKTTSLAGSFSYIFICFFLSLIPCFFI